MKKKRYLYSPQLSYEDKWRMVLFQEEVLDCLKKIPPTTKTGTTERMFLTVFPYSCYAERCLLFKFVRYINAHPYHLWNTVNKWSGNITKYSRLLIKDADEIGYVDIALLYRT